MVKSILIVDDEQPIQYLLSKLLENWGYRSVAVSSGTEALARLRTRQFDLMLLDVRMPGISGLEVLKKSKMDFPSMPVVMLSAVIDLHIVADAIALGAADYVRKPCNPDDLEATIREVIERRELKNQVNNDFKATGLATASSRG